MVILQLEQQPLLIQAIFTGKLEDVQSVLRFNSDVNYLDSEKRSPLHAASFKGCADIASLLITNGARVNTKDSRWITPLHRACCCGSSDLVTLLLEYQADTTARDRQWQTPLHVAAANNAYECVQQLLSCVPNPNVTDRMRRTALHHAAINGHTDVVELLLSKGCIVNACDKKDCRPLHCAAHMGHVDTIDVLLRHRADINGKDRNQYTPLHVAATSGMVDVCKELLTSGAQVDMQNAYGNTALHIACLNGHLSVCQVLISFGADVEATNYRGQTPLHIAAASTHGNDCLNYLVNQKVNINKQSLEGRTPLHMTAIHGRFTRSKTLIDCGAVVDCVDKNDCTSLHIAALYGHDLLSNTLLSHGADPSKKGYLGRTPLHMSSLSGYVECCRKFLQANVDLNAQDDSGKTPIHCAAYKGSVDCLDLLVSNGANFNLVDGIGRIPLHYAASQGHYPCVFTLVGLGSSVNLCDLEGCSALHLAAAYDLKGECVEYLLRHKGDPKLKDKKGFTPIHYAVAGQNFMGLGFLLSIVGNNYVMSGPDMPLTTPLHLAAKHGNQDILQLLMPYFIDINIRTENGSTALLLAARGGHTHCVQMLLRFGAKVALTDHIYHMSPVHYSAKNGHMHCLALLLDNTEDKNVIDLRDSLQRTALMLSVSGGHTNCALTLLKCGADPNVVDAEKHSSLFRAIVNGQHSAVEILISNGAEVGIVDVHGKSVLHLAAACGRFSSLEMVLKCMQPEESKRLDNQGFTALHWASYNGNPNCVTFLLQKDIFKELIGNVFSPIHCATIVGAERCVELLCQYFGSSSVKLKDTRNRTPLHIAAIHGHVDCAKYLLEQGAELNCQDADGRTPLICAASNGQSQIIDFLISHKADMTMYDINGNTALHLACLKRHNHSALLLLENIEDTDIVNMINNDRKTPLHLSARNGLVNVTRELIGKGSSVLALDANGMSPALCCAPNSSVAQCLALILANYSVCSKENSNKATTLSISFLKLQCKHKKLKTFITQDSQTSISLLCNPDFFECQKMFNLPHVKKINFDGKEKSQKLSPKSGVRYKPLYNIEQIRKHYSQEQNSGCSIKPETSGNKKLFDQRSVDSNALAIDADTYKNIIFETKSQKGLNDPQLQTCSFWEDKFDAKKNLVGLYGSNLKQLNSTLEKTVQRVSQEIINQGALMKATPGQDSNFVPNVDAFSKNLQDLAISLATYGISDQAKTDPNFVQNMKLKELLTHTLMKAREKYMKTNEGAVDNAEQNLNEDCHKFLSNTYFRESRIQKMGRQPSKQFVAKKAKNMMKLKQKQSLTDLKTLVEIAGTASSTLGTIGNKCFNDSNKNTLEKNVVEELYVNPVCSKENVKPTSDQQSVEKYIEMLQEEFAKEGHERLHNCQKALTNDKIALWKDNEYESHVNIIIHGLELIKSTKSLQCIVDHMRLFDKTLEKWPESLPTAVEIMKHIITMLNEADWLQNLKIETWKKEDFSVKKAIEEKAVKNEKAASEKESIVKPSGKENIVKPSEKENVVKPSENVKKPSANIKKKDIVSTGVKYKRPINLTMKIPIPKTTVQPDKVKKPETEKAKEKLTKIPSHSKTPVYVHESKFLEAQQKVISLSTSETTTSKFVGSCSFVPVVEKTSASKLTLQNLETYDSNSDLHKHFCETKEDEPVAKADEVISGTISLVSYLSVQKEMELTLNSIDDSLSPTEDIASNSEVKEQELESSLNQGDKILDVNLTQSDNKLVGSESDVVKEEIKQDQKEKKKIANLTKKFNSKESGCCIS